MQARETEMKAMGVGLLANRLTVMGSRVVFEAEAGGSKAGGLPPTFPFPSSPFPFPLRFQTNQWEGKPDPVRGKFPGFPPTNTTLMGSNFFKIV